MLFIFVIYMAIMSGIGAHAKALERFKTIANIAYIAYIAF